MRALKIYFVALATLLFCGCVAGEKLSIVVDVDPVRWRDAAHFSIMNSDTTSLRDISIFVRSQPSNRRVDSLPLHVVTIAPDQVQAVEQFTIYFNYQVGDKWLPRLYREAIFRKDVKLSQSGEYKMLVYPHRPTEGVEAIGIAID